VTEESFSNKDIQTKGVKTLLGDPKKAIIKLAIPMIIAMSVQTVYNFADAFWVSLLGANQLAAVGFILPFFMMAIAISTGIGVGSSSAVSRKIGAKDKEGADNVADHSIILVVVLGVLFTVFLFFGAEFLLKIMGASESFDLAITYGKIIFAGSLIIFFINMAIALLRGEGDVKKAMYAIIAGSVLNIVLDPIFIFVFGLGIAGAAYATVLSMAISSLLLAYWLFFRKNTYITFNLKHFKFKRNILFDIFKVGLPASFQQLTMSVMMIVMNFIIVNIAVAGDAGVAVYSTGWRVVSIAILPLLGLATAVTSVTGAAYGAKEYKKLNEGFVYSLKFGLLIESMLAVLIFLIAPFITMMFTTGQGSAEIASDLETFIRISVLFYPGAAFGIASSAMFQGAGKGNYALIITAIRTIILIPLIAIVFCCFFSLGLIGIWWGIVLANLLGSIIAFGCAKIFINHMFKSNGLLA
jgi:putative MATE family efflux protein